MEKTGTWIWPERYSDLKILEVKPSDIDFIKSLIVGWNTTELGAPAFMTKNGDWLYDIFEDKPKKECLLSLFVNQAKFDGSCKTYNNPLTSDDLDDDVKNEALYGFPNKELKQLLATEKVIQVDVTETVQALWNSCWLSASGFDPKRGFNLANLQELIDPEKQLTKSELTKNKQHYKGVLFMYLQLFIKEATLEPGFYHSYDTFNWLKGKDVAIANELTASEWWSNFNLDYFKELAEFVEIMAALPKLIAHFSVKKTIDYQYIASILNLDTLFKYDSDNLQRSDISLEEILVKSLDCFPEEKEITDHQEGYPCILLLVRIYNAQGRFNEAQKLLQEHNLDLFSEQQLAFFCTQPNKYQQIAFYESCICKMAHTGNYDLWRFPDYPKFTQQEIETFQLHTGAFFLDNPEDKKNYETEQKKIERLLKARGTLKFDMRNYLQYRFLEDINSIYEDLEKNNLKDHLDAILVSIVGQINVLSEISYCK